MLEIRAGFNYMRSRAVHAGGINSQCHCNCQAICSSPPNIECSTQGVMTCLAHYHTFKSASQIWESIVCAKAPGEKWHRLECIKGMCTLCGFGGLAVCPKELSSDATNPVAWRCFEKVITGKTRDGKTKEVIRLENKLTSPRQFLQYAAPKLKEFVMHNFVASWQDKEYKWCLQNIREGEMVSLIDFAENYSFKGQNEIQSEHWYNFQVTILVHITFIFNPLYDPSVKHSKRHIMEYHYYISDDRKHDNLFVQWCFKLHWDYLKAKGQFIKRHIVWSDGCASQFKGARSWFHIARNPSLTKCNEVPGGVQMVWHYWGTGHGKGPHDGAGACVKQALRKEQLKAQDGVILQNAHDVVMFLEKTMDRQHLAYEGARRDVNRNFWEIKLGDVNRDHGYDCRTIVGSRSKHSVRSVSSTNNTLLEIREFSCFCIHCTDGVPGKCPQRNHVDNWNLITLEPCNSFDAQCEQDEEGEVQGSGDDLALGLEVGDNLCVRAESGNEEGVKFYALQCTKVLHSVASNMGPDAYNQTVERGSDIVCGLYYQRCGRAPTSYTLLRDQGPALIFSHLVKITKFPMVMATHKLKGGTTVYSMPISTLQQIESLISSREDTDSDSNTDSDLNGGSSSSEDEAS